MKAKDWFFVIFPLLVVWLIDRLTKQWALDLTGLEFYGPFGLVLHQNHGAILGLFSNLPPVLRVVTLSTGGGFLVVSYAIVQYLLPIRSITLRAGMSVLLGGILGNVTDRILWGYVVDFLIIGTREMPSPAFNMADAFQWVGYAMLVVALIRDGDLLWPANDTREVYWVNPKFQIKYCLTLMGAGLGFSLVAGVFAYTYLRVTIIELQGHNDRLLDQFLIPFFMTFTVVSLAFSILLFLFGRALSHRIAGPLYAFERYMRDVLNGQTKPLRMRTGDEFKELEVLAKEITDELARARKEAKAQIKA